MNNMFYPMPKKVEQKEGFFKVLPKLSICSMENFSNNAAKLLIKKILLFCNATESKEPNSADIVFEKKECHPEGYTISVGENKIIIGVNDKNGAIYAAQTLGRLIASCQSIPCMEVEDEPYKKYRGIHLYMPGEDYMDECKRLIDVLCYLRYNTIIIEVGASMKLEKHPEINKAWLGFCTLAVDKFPGGPQNLQWSERYWKDSTHFEVGRRKIVSKEAVRSLVNYAKDLGMCVIPEIQALSHCYYLTMAHREIAEDINDMFPDTYCPQNEKSYELYFDVADEIIEVFKPEIVSIGHDEIRIMGECPKCKGKNGGELLSYEINRLHDFYKEKNIRIMMWCDKILPSMNEDGTLRNNGDSYNKDAYGREWRLPSTISAIDSLPRDIIMLDWYHSLNAYTSKYFTDKGFDAMYGNFSGIAFGSWDKRSENVIGAEISPWCIANEFIIARNGVMFDLIFSSGMLWREDYCDSKYKEFREIALQEVPFVRDIIRTEKSPEGEIELLFDNKEGEYELSTDGAKCYGENAIKLAEMCKTLKGVPVDTGNILHRTSIYAESLLFCESFKKAEDYLMNYSFINAPHWEDAPSSSIDYLNVNKPRWSAATHEILYEDGTLELANAVYGITACDINLDISRVHLTTSDGSNEIDEVNNASKVKVRELPHFKLKDEWQKSVVYFSDIVETKEGTAFVYEWKNPHPDKKIVCIKAVNTTHDLEQSAILFALAYKKKDTEK